VYIRGVSPGSDCLVGMWTAVAWLLGRFWAKIFGGLPLLSSLSLPLDVGPLKYS